MNSLSYAEYHSLLDSSKTEEQYVFISDTEEDGIGAEYNYNNYHTKNIDDTVVKRKVIRGKLPWKNVDYYLHNDSIHKSIHQEESEKYAQYNFSSDAQWDSLRFFETGKQHPHPPAPFEGGQKRSSRACNLNKRVYGWHPYWNPGLEANYDWNGLTDFCYFSYEVNSATGAAITTHNFATAPAVTTALASGVNVTLCATLFSGHTAFFASSTFCTRSKRS